MRGMKRTATLTGEYSTQGPEGRQSSKQRAADLPQQKRRERAHPFQNVLDGMVAANGRGTGLGLRKATGLVAAEPSQFVGYVSLF